MDCYSCGNECKNTMQGKDVPNIPTSTPNGHPTEGSTNNMPSVPSSITLGTPSPAINHGGGGEGDAMAGKGKM